MQHEINEYKMQQLLEKQYISLNNDLHKDYIPKNIDIYKSLSYKEKKLFKDTLYMQVGLISGVVALYFLPESVSKWSPEQKKMKKMDYKWLENVKEGPVVDKDDFFINYIGHPVSGAYYYTVARNDGYGCFGSFIYSFFISTFVWEYGYESFAEVPSVQDIISTPVVGAIMGEGLYHLEKQLDKNHGLIYGSRALGNIAYVFLNPLGRLSQSLDNTFGFSSTIRFQTYQSTTAKTQDSYNTMLNKPYQHSNYNYGVIISLEF
jgi:hypothetical protein